MARRRPSRSRARPEPPSPQSRSWPPLTFAAALLAVGAWAFATSTQGVLVLDDIRAIARNPTIRTLWPLSTPLAPPTGSTVAGRPIANLSFAVNYALAPADARDAFLPDRVATDAGDERVLRNLRGYHLLNIAIHLAAGLTLFGVVRRTMTSERLRGRFGATAPWLAFGVAALWLVHPLQTASVTYLVQRVESLMGLFYLLALYCAIRAQEGPRAAWWTGASIAACALGMATKEVMVTAPILVGLWLWTFGGTGAPRRHWRLLAGLAACWLVLAALVARESRTPSIAPDPAVVWSYFLTQADVVTHYLRLSLWPSPLVFLYTWPLAASIAEVVVPAAFLTGLSIATAVAVIRRHPLGFVGAWFFLILAPSSSLLPIVTEVAAEHRMYLPLASVVACVVLGAFLAAGLARAGEAGSTRSRTSTGVVVLVTLVLVAVLGSGTRARNRDYWSAERLWRDTVSKQPANARARTAYGEVLAQAGRYAEAEPQLQAAVDLEPGDAVALTRLGSVQAAQGNLDGAIANLERALALRPEDLDAHRAIGLARAVRREDARALPHLDRVLAAQPDDPFLLAQIAGILADSGDVSIRDGRRAVNLAQRAVRLTSRRDPGMLEILSAAHATAGQMAEAVTAAAEALAIARAQGNQSLVSRLEYRLSAYKAFQRSHLPR
jgi:tetratricopeptide (TPR) repeat protein